MEKILDKTKLKQIANGSKTASNAMTVLGLRERARAYTVLSQLKQQLLQMGENVVDRDYMDFWRGLEATGAGSLVIGRRGKQTRFEWNYSCKDIAKFAIENSTQELKPVIFKTSKKDILKSEPVRTHKSSENHVTKSSKLVYSIQVRPGYVLEVNLPQDISSQELEKISKAFSVSN